jgi:chromosome segregation protein
MLIKRLELQGFKTFPDRTKILFNPGITIIIGPNGTGKSNIVEAIQWVFGGQRVKSVRGEKIDDAIFTGTAGRPPVGMADVSLILQDGEEEMSINHRAFRSGESEYRLDGKTVRLKDIQDELWRKSISENRYFVIEQGAIGTFVTSKPSEKRALIEEAAGTAFYKDKKRQAENKLEDSEQNLVRLEDILAEVSKAKNSLARQAGAAERYRKVRERIRELTGLHFRHKSAQLEAARREAQAQFDGASEAERDLQSRLGTQERSVARIRQEAWDLEQSLKEGAEGLFALRSQIARLEADREREGKRIEFFVERREKASADADELLAEILALDRDIGRGQEERSQNGSELEAKSAEARDLELSHQDTEALAAPQAAKLAALRAEAVDAFAAVTAARNEEAKLEKEIELIRRQEEKLRSRQAEMRSELESSRTRLDALAALKTATEGRISDERARLEALKAGSGAAAAEIEELEAEIRGLKEKRDAGAYHLRALEKLEAKERGQEPGEGAEGTLGLFADLFESDPADAPLIDVFWKDETRAAVIPQEDFLRNLGLRDLRGTFLLISGAGPAAETPDVPADPEIMGSLRARLRPSGRGDGRTPSLSDAVIVPDIRSAVRLWSRHPGRNFVTPSGDILLSSGLAKLGSPKEGLFTLHQEMKDLERTIARWDEDLKPPTERLARSIADKGRLEDDLSNATVALAGLEKDLVQAERDLSLDQAFREKLENDLAVSGHELEILGLDREGFTWKWEVRTADRRALEADEAGLKAAAEKAETEIAALQDRSGGESKTLLELKSAGDVLRAKIESLDGLVRTFGQRKEAAQTKAAALEAEIAASREEEERLGVLIAELGEKAAGLEVRKSERERTLAEDEKRHETLRAGLAEAENALNEIRERHDRQKDERSGRDVRRAEIDRDLVNLEETCWQELKKTLAEVRAEAAESPEGGGDVEAELEEAREEIGKFKAVNLMAEEEYREQKARFDFLVRERQDLRDSISQTKEAIQQIDGESRDRFLAALSEVNRNFQDLFEALFKGGTAEVRLTDEANPLESGVDILAQPPGKKVGNMSLLSGGEKSLTSLAFLFALFRFKPTPFCILDEVDAALDEANLARFLDLMKKIKNETQFIIITHNYKTMEVADYIYGTTMEEPNVTKIFSMKFEKRGEAAPVA